jgi:serine/threonine protein kinase
MWKQTLFDGSDLGLSKPFKFTELSSIVLPRMRKSMIFLPSGELRAHLEKTGRSGGGAHGHLEECTRSDNSGKQFCLIKTSNLEDAGIQTEAFIQWIVQKTLEAEGLGSRVPKVYEIFRHENTSVGFTMHEVIDSKLCSRYLSESQTLERDILHCLAQTAILLQRLEERLELDHRDLKADNLIISAKPSSMKWKGRAIESPFTVHIVDFGFACMGNSGITEVDASDGTLPLLDPCPKEGRDLFHLIVSFYGIPSVRTQLTEPLKSLFSTWLTVNDKSCAGMAEKWHSTEWLYLITSQKKFSNPSCRPEAILETLAPLL